MSQISLTFPDGAVRGFNAGVTGRDVAEQISKSLAKKAVAVQLDGKARDLAEPIRTDARIRIPMREGMRSINVAIAGALILGEALRQTNAFASLT